MSEVGRNGDIIRIVIPPGSTGRHRYAREAARSWLKPGEELEETAASWPVYMYKVRRVATPFLFTPEEVAMLDDALGMADRYLAQALGIESETGRQMIIEKMGRLQALRKKVTAT